MVPVAAIVGGGAACMTKPRDKHGQADDEETPGGNHMIVQLKAQLFPGVDRPWTSSRPAGRTDVNGKPPAEFFGRSARPEKDGCSSHPAVRMSRSPAWAGKPQQTDAWTKIDQAKGPSVSPNTTGQSDVRASMSQRLEIDHHPPCHDGFHVSTRQDRRQFCSTQPQSLAKAAQPRPRNHQITTQRPRVTCAPNMGRRRRRRNSSRRFLFIPTSTLRFLLPLLRDRLIHAAKTISVSQLSLPSLTLEPTASLPVPTITLVCYPACETPEPPQDAWHSARLWLGCSQASCLVLLHSCPRHILVDEYLVKNSPPHSRRPSYITRVLCTFCHGVLVIIFLFLSPSFPWKKNPPTTKCKIYCWQ